MNWAKLKLNANIAPKPTVGCGIPPGFGNKQYETYNSKLYEMMDRHEQFDIEFTRLTLFEESDLDGMIRVTSTIKDAFDDNKTDSVLDARFGTTEKDKVCGTCCQTMLTCPGHYGYIKLSTPIIHPMYHSSLISILRSVCHNCGELIAAPSHIHGSGQERLAIAEKIGTSVRKCDKCSYVNYLIMGESPKTSKDYTMASKNEVDLIDLSFPKKKTTKEDKATLMSVKEIDSILTRITHSAKRHLGMDEINLRSLILKFIVVTPISTRPGSNLTGTFENSNMTSMYDRILYASKHIDQESVKSRNNYYYLIHRMIDKASPVIPRLELFKNLKEQLSRKSGVFRSNAMGKRVDFASRTVLSPASETCVGEMSYPSEAAKKVTVPEIVTRYNIDRLRDLWIQGWIVAITPKTPSHPQYNQTLFTNKLLLDRYQPYIGDICHRQVMTGDIVMFNRQPTLDRYSLMACQALMASRNKRVHGLNSCATKPHNADFDGDEGNVYILQTIESMAEGRLISNIRNNIVSMSFGSPIVSIQYHGVIGLYNLTKDDIVMDLDDWNDALNLFWGNRSAFTPGGLHGFTEWDRMKVRTPESFFARLKESGIAPTSGKALFSMLLPENFYYTRDDVVIRSGILLKGPLKKGDVGGSNGGIVHLLALMHGNEVASNFLSSAQKMSDWYMMNHSISISLSTFSPVVEANVNLSNYYKSTLGINGSLSDTLLDQIHEEYKHSESANVAPEITEWVTKHRGELNEYFREFGLDKDFVYGVKHIVHNAHKRIQEQVDKLPKRDNMSVFEKEDRENKILNIASRVNKTDRDQGVKLLGKGNVFLQLVDSGAKGSMGNLVQLSTSIGQTSVHGKRPEYEVGRTRENPTGTRTLMFFEGKDDPNFKETIESRGYVNSSYVSGPTPAQFIFSMAQERIGVITSRISTAESGYFTRQLLKFSEDLRVNSTGDVVSAQRRYVCPTILEGFDVSKTIKTGDTINGKYNAPFDTNILIKQLMGDVVNRRKGQDYSSMSRHRTGSRRSRELPVVKVP